MTYQNLIISAIRDKAAQIDGDVRVDYSDHGSCSVIVEAEDASLFLILGPQILPKNCISPKMASEFWFTV